MHKGATVARHCLLAVCHSKCVYVLLLPAPQSKDHSMPTQTPEEAEMVIYTGHMQRENPRDKSSRGREK